MSSDSEQETETEVRLSPELRSSAVSAQQGAQSFFDQGTGGIFQDSVLADEDPLIRQAQEEQLRLLGQGGDLRNLIDQQQQSFSGLLSAGDINDPLTQRRISDLSDVVGEQFNRTILPGINQGATAAGQFGSSRQGIAQGLAAGEAANAISRGATSALLGGQQLSLQAQGLAPSAVGLGLLPTNAQQDIGFQRGQRDQQELLDRIQSFEAPRRAELQNLQQFTALLAANPLLAESNQTTTQQDSGSDLQTAIGIASIAAAPFTGGASLAFAGGVPGGGGGGFSRDAGGDIIPGGGSGEGGGFFDNFSNPFSGLFSGSGGGDIIPGA